MHANTSANGEERKQDFETKCIHAGQHPDPISGAVMTPISMSSTFAQKSPGVLYPMGLEYSRTGNPTRNTFEKCVAALEGATHGLAFASGSAATATIMHLLKTGDHVLSLDDLYGGTNRYFQRVCGPQQGIEFTLMDVTAPDWATHLRPNTKLIWVESPSNPLLKLVDLQAVAKEAKARGIITVCDNTFASPYFQRPLEHGIDVVVHSCTKYLNGHSDAVLGIVLTSSDEICQKLRFLQNGIGAIPSPFDCYLALRGVKTLHVRMERHQANATQIATFLESHPKVDKVIYPGLKSHPQHDLAQRQMSGFGGMITFYPKGGLDECRKLLETLQVFTLAESLGGVESLVENPAIMTHASVPIAERKKLGITDNLIRLSVGIESVNDLIDDLKRALEVI